MSCFCTYCGQEANSADSRLGVTARCPSCGKYVVVPTGGRRNSAHAVRNWRGLLKNIGIAFGGLIVFAVLFIVYQLLHYNLYEMKRFDIGGLSFRFWRDTDVSLSGGVISLKRRDFPSHEFMIEITPNFFEESVTNPAIAQLQSYDDKIIGAYSELDYVCDGARSYRDINPAWPRETRIMVFRPAKGGVGPQVTVLTMVQDAHLLVGKVVVSSVEGVANATTSFEIGGFYTDILLTDMEGLCNRIRQG